MTATVLYGVFRYQIDCACSLTNKNWNASQRHSGTCLTASTTVTKATQKLQVSQLLVRSTSNDGMCRGSYIIDPATVRCNNGSYGSGIS